MASAAVVLATPAAAQDSRAYFIAHIADPDSPEQLANAEATYYRAMFDALDREDWEEFNQLLAEREEGLLHHVAQAEYYLHANSPRVEAAQISDWLDGGTNLPQAERLIRLGTSRGLERAPRLTPERPFRSVGDFPRRVRPPTVNDDTMPGEVRQAILAAISDDDPDNARILLDGVDAALSPEARAEWRQRVAWSYFIENRDPEALAMAQTVSAGSGAWVAEGEWVAGLAAWRLSDCQEAQQAFRRSAFQASNIELRAAALYWASRAALRCREPRLASQLLAEAAGNDQTLYGMLAAEQLGRTLPERVSTAELSDEDWQQIGRLENVRIAIALAQIDRDELASQVLLHQARTGDPAHYGALSRLARDLGFPQTQLYMAYNAPSGGRADPASFYPVPRWEPVTGWRVDPALAYAHILQESAFRSSARSPANAQGLMQITPITVRQHAGRLNMSASAVDIYDPAVNLAFGQRNLEMLRDDPATSRQLPKVMAAYNAGLAPVTRWNSEIRDFDDPLLYMEAIPYWETRGYVSIVMRNYWMYERQARAQSPSRLALAQNDWPLFPEGDGENDRVYMSTGSN